VGPPGCWARSSAEKLMSSPLVLELGLLCLNG
jgi:hypothetical protein